MVRSTPGQAGGSDECAFALDGANVRLAYRIDDQKKKCNAANQTYRFSIEEAAQDAWSISSLRLNQDPKPPPDLIGEPGDSTSARAATARSMMSCCVRARGWCSVPRGCLE
jgi:hypothetical protein